MIYGYCRVSTPAQEKDGHSLEAQSDELYRQGAEIIWSDTFTGTRTDRPQFQKLLGVLQAGDTLLVTKIDRIGRSVGQVNDVITELLSRGVTVHVLNLGVLDASPTGQLIRTIMLAFAQFERDMIVQRTQEGKAIARKNPSYREGRRPKFSREQINHALEMLEDNSYSQVERMTGISKSTLIRAKRKQRLELK